jgi:hypothetical protein
MTLEQLLECDAATLEKMTDEQLLEHFKPYLTVTRPELVVRKTNEPKPQQVYIPPAKKAALALLAEEGIDLSFVNKRKKR